MNPPAPESESAAAAKPRSKRIYVYWGIALSLLLTAGLVCWKVVVPVMQARSLVKARLEIGEEEAHQELRKYGGRVRLRTHTTDEVGSLAVIHRHGGQARAARLIERYLRCPKALAPDGPTAVVLLRSCGKQGLSALGRALRNTRDDVRVEAAFQLGLLEAEAGFAIPELTAATRDRNPDVRQAAAEALEKIKAAEKRDAN